jgi:hypothetical protein
MICGINKKLCIIPAARQVIAEISNEFGEISPIMIPFNGKSVILNILENTDYKEFDFLVISYTNEKSTRYIKKLLRKYDNCKIIYLENSNSLAHTIIQSKKIIKQNNYEEIVINFGDTIISNLNQIKGDIIYYSIISSKHFNWTIFTIRNNLIELIKDKKSNIDGLDLNIFIGVFSISDPELFLKTLEQAYQSKKDLDSFWETIQNYYNKKNTVYIKPQAWHDFGHIDNYYKAKNSYFIARSFNEVTLSQNQKYIIKTSKNSEKLKDEIEWFLKIPKDISYIAPKLIDHKLDKENIESNLEFFNYPTLSDLYVFGNLPICEWRKIFQRIREYLLLFKKYEYKNPKENHKDLHSIYFKKTIKRIDAIKNNINFEKFTKKLDINGKICYSILEVQEMLPEVINKFGILNNKIFYLTHGDMCFSNMLYKKGSNDLKLIDPRGSFGKSGIYGDQLYDIAKLSHSIIGMYDFIITGMYDFEEYKSNILIKEYKTNLNKKIGLLFLDMLNSMNLSTKDFTKIRFIESLLFISMVPLHADNVEKQKIFLAKGLLLFSKIIDNKNIDS